MTKLGWPFEDEKEAAVGSLQSQIRPGGESSLVEQWNTKTTKNIKILMRKKKNIEVLMRKRWVNQNYTSVPDQTGR